MGNQLARHAEAILMDGGHRAKGLTPTARLVLVIMAMDAHDTGTTSIPPAYYYRGWPHLARMLGHDGLTPGGHSAVARAIRQLVAAGLVEADDAYRPPGWKARGYRLTL
jgi:hypothetical protein